MWNEIPTMYSVWCALRNGQEHLRRREWQHVHDRSPCLNLCQNVKGQSWRRSVGTFNIARIFETLQCFIHNHTTIVGWLGNQFVFKVGRYGTIFYSVSWVIVRRWGLRRRLRRQGFHLQPNNAPIRPSNNQQGQIVVIVALQKSYARDRGFRFCLVFCIRIQRTTPHAPKSLFPIVTDLLPIHLFGQCHFLKPLLQDRHWRR
mmetsp:Transcript_4841/g.11549  ORF Transcript_4841/g.11549 Transcript_4841/m.11549 type:complete len:202 (-) Transcript_4841:424-1029(-)